MDWLLQVLFGAWWYGQEGRSRSADASDKFVLPLIILFAAGVLGGLLIYFSQL